MFRTLTRRLLSRRRVDEEEGGGGDGGDEKTEAAVRDGGNGDGGDDFEDEGEGGDGGGGEGVGEKGAGRERGGEERRGKAVVERIAEERGGIGGGGGGGGEGVEVRSGEDVEMGWEEVEKVVNDGGWGGGGVVLRRSFGLCAYQGEEVGEGGQKDGYGSVGMGRVGGKGVFRVGFAWHVVGVALHHASVHCSAQYALSGGKEGWNRGFVGVEEAFAAVAKCSSHYPRLPSAICNQLKVAILTATRFSPYPTFSSVFWPHLRSYLILSKPPTPTPLLLLHSLRSSLAHHPYLSTLHINLNRIAWEGEWRGEVWDGEGGVGSLVEWLVQKGSGDEVRIVVDRDAWSSVTPNLFSTSLPKPTSTPNRQDLTRIIATSLLLYLHDLQSPSLASPSPSPSPAPSSQFPPIAGGKALDSPIVDLQWVKGGWKSGVDALRDIGYDIGGSEDRLGWLRLGRVDGGEEREKARKGVVTDILIAPVSNDPILNSLLQYTPITPITPPTTSTSPPHPLTPHFLLHRSPLPASPLLDILVGCDFGGAESVGKGRDSGEKELLGRCGFEMVGLEGVGSWEEVVWMRRGDGVWGEDGRMEERRQRARERVKELMEKGLEMGVMKLRAMLSNLIGGERSESRDDEDKEGVEVESVVVALRARTKGIAPLLPLIKSTLQTHPLPSPSAQTTSQWADIVSATPSTTTSPSSPSKHLPSLPSFAHRPRPSHTHLLSAGQVAQQLIPAFSSPRESVALWAHLRDIAPVCTLLDLYRLCAPQLGELEQLALLQFTLQSFSPKPTHPALTRILPFFITRSHLSILLSHFPNPAITLPTQIPSSNALPLRRLRVWLSNPTAQTIIATIYNKTLQGKLLEPLLLRNSTSSSTTTLPRWISERLPQDVSDGSWEAEVAQRVIPPPTPDSASSSSPPSSSPRKMDWESWWMDEGEVTTWVRSSPFLSLSLAAVSPRHLASFCQALLPPPFTQIVTSVGDVVRALEFKEAYYRSISTSLLSLRSFVARSQRTSDGDGDGDGEGGGDAGVVEKVMALVPKSSKKKERVGALSVVSRIVAAAVSAAGGKCSHSIAREVAQLSLPESADPKTPLTPQWVTGFARSGLLRAEVKLARLARALGNRLATSPSRGTNTTIPTIPTPTTHPPPTPSSASSESGKSDGEGWKAAMQLPLEPVAAFYEALSLVERKKGDGGDREGEKEIGVDVEDTLCMALNVLSLVSGDGVAVVAWTRADVVTLLEGKSIVAILSLIQSKALGAAAEEVGDEDARKKIELASGLRAFSFAPDESSLPSLPPLPPAPTTSIRDEEVAKLSATRSLLSTTSSQTTPPPTPKPTTDPTPTPTPTIPPTPTPSTTPTLPSIAVPPTPAAAPAFLRASSAAIPDTPVVPRGFSEGDDDDDGGGGGDGGEGDGKGGEGDGESGSGGGGEGGKGGKEGVEVEVEVEVDGIVGVARANNKEAARKLRKSGWNIVEGESGGEESGDLAAGVATAPITLWVLKKRLQKDGGESRTSGDEGVDWVGEENWSEMERVPARWVVIAARVVGRREEKIGLLRRGFRKALLLVGGAELWVCRPVYVEEEEQKSGAMWKEVCGMGERETKRKDVESWSRDRLVLAKQPPLASFELQLESKPPSQLADPNSYGLAGTIWSPRWDVASENVCGAWSLSMPSESDLEVVGKRESGEEEDAGIVVLCEKCCSGNSAASIYSLFSSLQYQRTLLTPTYRLFLPSGKFTLPPGSARAQKVRISASLSQTNLSKSDAHSTDLQVVSESEASPWAEALGGVSFAAAWVDATSSRKRPDGVPSDAAMLELHAQLTKGWRPGIESEFRSALHIRVTAQIGQSDGKEHTIGRVVLPFESITPAADRQLKASGQVIGTLKLAATADVEPYPHRIVFPPPPKYSKSHLQLGLKPPSLPGSPSSSLPSTATSPMSPERRKSPTKDGLKVDVEEAGEAGSGDGEEASAGKKGGGEEEEEKSVAVEEVEKATKELEKWPWAAHLPTARRLAALAKSASLESAKETIPTPPKSLSEFLVGVGANDSYGFRLVPASSAIAVRALASLGRRLRASQSLGWGEDGVEGVFLRHGGSVDGTMPASQLSRVLAQYWPLSASLSPEQRHAILQLLTTLAPLPPPKAAAKKGEKEEGGDEEEVEDGCLDWRFLVDVVAGGAAAEVWEGKEEEPGVRWVAGCIALARLRFAMARAWPKAIAIALEAVAAGVPPPAPALAALWEAAGARLQPPSPASRSPKRRLLSRLSGQILHFPTRSSLWGLTASVRHALRLVRAHAAATSHAPKQPPSPHTTTHFLYHSSSLAAALDAIGCPIPDPARLFPLLCQTAGVSYEESGKDGLYVDVLALLRSAAHGVGGSAVGGVVDEEDWSSFVSGGDSVESGDGKRRGVERDGDAESKGLRHALLRGNWVEEGVAALATALQAKEGEDEKPDAVLVWVDAVRRLSGSWNGSVPLEVAARRVFEREFRTPSNHLVVPTRVLHWLLEGDSEEAAGLCRAARRSLLALGVAGAERRWRRSGGKGPEPSAVEVGAQTATRIRAAFRAVDPLGIGTAPTKATAAALHTLLGPVLLPEEINFLLLKFQIKTQSPTSAAHSIVDWHAMIAWLTGTSVTAVAAAPATFAREIVGVNSSLLLLPSSSTSTQTSLPHSPPLPPPSSPMPKAIVEHGEGGGGGGGEVVVEKKKEEEVVGFVTKRDELEAFGKAVGVGLLRESEADIVRRGRKWAKARGLDTPPRRPSSPPSTPASPPSPVPSVHLESPRPDESGVWKGRVEGEEGRRGAAAKVFLERGKWTCESCAWRNHTPSDHCEICLAPNPFIIAFEDASEGKGERWVEAEVVGGKRAVWVGERSIPSGKALDTVEARIRKKMRKEREREREVEVGVEMDDVEEEKEYSFSQVFEAWNGRTPPRRQRPRAAELREEMGMAAELIYRATSLPPKPSSPVTPPRKSPTRVLDISTTSLTSSHPDDDVIPKTPPAPKRAPHISSLLLSPSSPTSHSRSFHEPDTDPRPQPPSSKGTLPWEQLRSKRTSHGPIGLV